MVRRVDAVILWARDPARTLAFYRSIGLPLETEDHGDGAVHHACDVSGVHFAIQPAGEAAGGARTRGEVGATQVSLRVDALAPVIEALRAHGARMHIDPQPGPWGTRIVVEDPDGRPVQITEA